MSIDTYTIGRDRNGNKIVRVRPAFARGFSIQTLGNLPDTHANGVTVKTGGEVRAYVKQFGTRNQKEALGLLP